MPCARRGLPRRRAADSPRRGRGRQLDRAAPRRRSRGAGAGVARGRAVGVLVAGPAARARPLSDALRAHGFDVVEQPLIEIEPVSDEPIEVDGYDWVVVTSPNGAGELTRRASHRPPPVAAVGPGPAHALAAGGGGAPPPARGS